MAKSAAKEKKEAAVSVEIPVRDPDPDKYMTTHVNVQLNRQQAYGLRRVFDALNGGAFRMEDGKYVQHAGDVVRYILEKVAAAE